MTTFYKYIALKANFFLDKLQLRDNLSGNVILIRPHYSYWIKTCHYMENRTIRYSKVSNI